MAPSEIKSATPESSGSLVLSRADESNCRFANLRGVRWRVNLGVLPSLASSIDEFRRATADSRRRYALLRRRLLVDPYVLKDDRNSPNLLIDNPLSQNPDSTWGQFFRNAELEKTLDQDLSRLYPEHWCYFQAPGFQGMLRRILLLWCLKHPEYGYRQGMHELLAPLLYVLHLDVKRLSEVRKNYEDYFTDRFDSLSYEERDITYTFHFTNFLDSMDDEIGSQRDTTKIKSLDELNPEVQSIVMLCDSYGAESELGIVLSEKFMEHDAYCMFDALMSGIHGCVAMAGFYNCSPTGESLTGLPPDLEACNAFYRLLAIVDSSLHNHLVELGVEPQYFGLRWLRVLFGREFLLQDLLLVWDEIFSANDNARTDTNDENSRNHSFKNFDCPRGTLISGMAVSMILYLRSSLLSTETATCCLQRLLNFPENIDLDKIIQKAKSLQALVLDVNVRSALSFDGVFDQSSSVPTRTKSFPSSSTFPKASLIIAPESYWEEKWRILQKSEEEERQVGLMKYSPPTQKKKRWLNLKVTTLFRAVKDLLHHKTGNVETNSSLETQSLLEDLSQQLSLDSEEANARDNFIDLDCPTTLNKENSTEEDMDFHSADEEITRNGNLLSEENSFVSSNPTSRSTVSNVFPGDSPSEENSSVSSDPTSPVRDSDSCPGENYKQKDQLTGVDSSLYEDNSIDKDKKLLPRIVKWFKKFGRSEETDKSNNSYAELNPQALSSDNNGDSDQNLMKTLKNLGQSMLEHIQLIEMVFQQEAGPIQAGLMAHLAKTSLIEKGQVTATTALKELRKISNLLSGM